MITQAKGGTPTVVQLVAVERGFANGVKIEAGTSFSFDRTPHPDTPKHKLAEDGLRRLPKWAKSKDEARVALAAKAAKEKAFDTKPKAAQAALKQKAAELTGSGESLA